MAGRNKRHLQESKTDFANMSWVLRKGIKLKRSKNFTSLINTRIDKHGLKNGSNKKKTIPFRKTLVEPISFQSHSNLTLVILGVWKKQRESRRSAGQIYERVERPTGNSPDSPDGHSGPEVPRRHMTCWLKDPIDILSVRFIGWRHIIGFWPDKRQWQAHL